METVSDTPGTALDEAALVKLARNGDGAAFDAIVRGHRSSVFAVARRMLGSVDEAEEVAQETFLRAWRSLASFRGEASLRTWLLRIAINVSRSAVARHRATEALDELPEPESLDPAPDRTADLDRARRAVRAAVAKLPPRQREVVALKIFSDMTYGDVATAMDLTTGAVKAHLHQAVVNLRRLMGDGGR